LNWHNSYIVMYDPIGVVSVSLEGESRDQVVVIGDYQIDCVCLTKKLRKKFCYVNLLSVEDANASASNEGDEAGKEQKDDEETRNSTENLSVVCCEKNYPPPCPLYYIVDHEPYPSSCSIQWKYTVLLWSTFKCLNLNNLSVLIWYSFF